MEGFALKNRQGTRTVVWAGCFWLLALILILQGAALAKAVSVRMWVSQPWAPDPESRVMVALRDKTSVDWQFILTDNRDMMSKLPLMLASGDLPDAIAGNSAELWGNLVKENALVPLDKYFSDAKKYPTLAKIDKRVLDAHRFPDGHLYYFPSNYEPDVTRPPDWTGNANGWWIRTDLLKKAGMDISDLSTLAGFERYLGAIKNLKDERGNPIIPFGLGENFAAWQVIASAFGFETWNQVGGQWVPYYKVAGFQNMMQWLNKLYSQGLLDQETPTQKNDRFNEKGFAGRYGAAVSGWSVNDWNFRWWNELQTTSKTWFTHIAVPKVPGVERPAPFHYYSPFGGGAGLAITRKSKNPDVVAAWADFILSREGQLLVGWGQEGWTYDLNEQGEVVVRQDVWADIWKGDYTVGLKKTGIWWWMFLMMRQVTDIKFVQAPGPASAKEIFANETRRRQEGTWVLAPSWVRMRISPDSVYMKYRNLQDDISKKYFARMIMAKPGEEFKKAYTDYLAEMKTQGHDEETTAAFNEAVSAFEKTPAGKIKIQFQFQASHGGEIY